MNPKSIVRSAASIALSVLSPWRAVKNSFTHLSRAKDAHRQNIVYIKDLYKQAAGVASDEQPASAARGTQSFEDAMNARSPGAPGIGELQKRFLLQKRLALGICAFFVLMALYALARGNLLGIATLLSCLPLFFMACLSAQLRLWQLRTRRLSKQERGGLQDFIREIDGWYWQVLDPELGKRPGEEP